MYSIAYKKKTYIFSISNNIMVSLDKLQELNKWWTKVNQFYSDDADLVKYQGM